MPRTKGSKNRPKINTTKDYATQIAEKQEIISQRYECGRDPRKTEIRSPCGQTELQEFTRYFLKVDI